MEERNFPLLNGRLGLRSPASCPATDQQRTSIFQIIRIEETGNAIVLRPPGLCLPGDKWKLSLSLFFVDVVSAYDNYSKKRRVAHTLLQRCERRRQGDTSTTCAPCGRGSGERVACRPTRPALPLASPSTILWVLAMRGARHENISLDS